MEDRARKAQSGLVDLLMRPFRWLRRRISWDDDEGFLFVVLVIFVIVALIIINGMRSGGPLIW